MDDVILDTLSTSHREQYNPVEALDRISIPLEINTTYNHADHTGDFLSFVSLSQKFEIPLINPLLLSKTEGGEGPTAVEATGSLGSGGQYFVDRIFENQRSLLHPIRQMLQRLTVFKVP